MQQRRRPQQQLWRYYASSKPFQHNKLVLTGTTRLDDLLDGVVNDSVMQELAAVVFQQEEERDHASLLSDEEEEDPRQYGVGDDDEEEATTIATPGGGGDEEEEEEEAIASTAAALPTSSTRNHIVRGDKGGGRIVLEDVTTTTTRRRNDKTGRSRDDPPRPSSSSSSSPVEVVVIRGHTVHLKRDDLLRLDGSCVSGNKARKMWTLNDVPAPQFPRRLVSYGGPQSNSMVALAAVVNHKNRELSRLHEQQQKQKRQLDGENDHNVGGRSTGDDDDDNEGRRDGGRSDTPDGGRRPIQFVYYTKRLPRFLRNQPSGNLYRAQTLGMELVELSHQEYSDLFEDLERNPQVHMAAVVGRRRRLPPPPRGVLTRLPPFVPSGGSGGGRDDDDEDHDTSLLWVPQGGAFASAKVGSYRLAGEIRAYWREHGMGRPLTVCIPGGTCTTAVLVHHGLKELARQEQGKLGSITDHHLEGRRDDDDDENREDACADLDIEVVVIPCVGDAVYARRQMMAMSVQIGADDPGDVPTILQPGPEHLMASTTTTAAATPRYFTFAQPDREILDAYRELRDVCNVVVDLVYGAAAFAILFRHWGDDGTTSSSSRDGPVEEDRPRLGGNPVRSFDPDRPLAGREFMYVHSGGVEGINSQMMRYQYEGLVGIQDIQLPGRRGLRSRTADSIKSEG
jgi:1-aminocyclopropane-1-carboxylate deaminase/D-cysteine desulfhydrase-like pyridoxal-dependent ACC family enzyme